MGTSSLLVFPIGCQHFPMILFVDPGKMLTTQWEINCRHEISLFLTRIPVFKAIEWFKK